MKNFWKVFKKHRYIILVVTTFLLALFVRFYNFEERITFGSEQARSLYVSAKYITEKPSLLGQEYFRVNSKGHKLFTSAIFNYTLIPLLLIFKYQPLPITFYFALLNVFTAFVLFYLCKKMFGETVAIFSLLIFVLNAYMIYHSMFIWVLNHMPLIGVLTFYILWKIYKKKNTTRDIFLLGILSGIGFGLEYLYALAILIIFYFLFKYPKNKFKAFFVFGLGSVVGDITQVLFDLKHNFYHVKTLFQYVLDTFNGVSDAGFVYYHFLHFWPVLAIVAGLLLHKIYKKNKSAAVILVLIYLVVNLNSKLISFSRPVGMPEGLDLKKLKTASELISDKSSENFNLVTLYDFDTRGYVLRYLVEFVFNNIPMGDVDYPNSPEIWALADKDYDFSGKVPWELTFLKPYNIEKVEKLSENFELLKITKAN